MKMSKSKRHKVTYFQEVVETIDCPVDDVVKIARQRVQSSLFNNKKKFIYSIEIEGEDESNRTI